MPEQSYSNPDKLSIDGHAFYFDGGSSELYGRDETGNRLTILLKCVLPDDTRPGEPFDPDWILCVNGQPLEKNSEDESRLIHLIEAAETPPDEHVSVADWDEDRKRFVFNNDAEAMRRAEREGLVAGISASISDFCDKFHSSRNVRE